MVAEICKFKYILGIPFRYNQCCAYQSIENPICWEKMQDVVPEAEAYLDSLILGLFSRSNQRQEDNPDVFQHLALALVCEKKHTNAVPSPGGALCQHSYLAWTFRERLNDWRRRNEADSFHEEEQPGAPQSEVCDLASALQTLTLDAQQEEQPNSQPQTPVRRRLQHLPRTPNTPPLGITAIGLDEVISTPTIGSDGNRSRSRSSSGAAAVEECTTPRLNDPILSSNATTPYSDYGSPLFSPGRRGFFDLDSSLREASTPMTDYSTDSSHIKSKRPSGQIRGRREEEPSPTKRKGQTACNRAGRSDTAKRGGRATTKSQLSEDLETLDDNAASSPSPSQQSTEEIVKRAINNLSRPRRDTIRFTVAEDARFEKVARRASAVRNGSNISATDIPTALKSFELIKFLRGIVSDNDHNGGFVYCFADKASPGYLKIGSARLRNQRNLVTHPVSDPPERDEDVWARLKKHVSTCDFELELKFVVFMPCAVVRMERLIHRTLLKEKRYIESGNCRRFSCKKKNVEWFETTVDEAWDVVSKWGAFSRLNPYIENGSLEKLWSDYADSRCKAFPELTGKQWVNQHLVKLTDLEMQRQEAIEMARNLLECSKRLSKQWGDYRRGMEELGGNPALRREDRRIDELNAMYSWKYGSLAQD